MHRVLLAALLLVAVAGLVACGDAEAHYFPLEDVTPLPVAESRAFPLSRDGPSGTFGYRVQHGDTLESIARQHNTTVDELRRINAIPEGGEAHPNTVLFIPQPTPTPTPTLTPTPSGPSAVVRHGPRGVARVALTFDMNGHEGTSQGIMGWLAENRVPATVFVTGSLVADTPYGQTVAAVVDANPDLFEFGNHSYSHPQLTGLSGEQIQSQLAATENAVAQHSSLPVRPYFRPPYGDYNQAVLNAAGASGYPYTVLWDVDPQDWRPYASASGIAQAVVSRTQGGSIVLLHLHGPQTKAALPSIVEGLRQRGFELVKLSELLE